MPDNPDIRHLFEPRSVAVIGVSTRKLNIGAQIVKNIKDYGYKGKIYPVNPKGGDLFGLPIYKSMADIDDDVDLVAVAVPAKYVFDTVKNCTGKAKFLLIISSGFSEIGNTEEEKKIVSFARENGMRVLGPNIFGIYDAEVSLNSTFGPSDISKGNVAIITQSGALGVSMIGKTAVENLGLSAIVSVGNKSDVDEADLLEHLVYHDDKTKVVLMYIEGIQQGEKLVGVLKKVSKEKPIVVIKSGRSRRGAVAAASHTGSLAGADEVFDDIMRQCGVLRAESIEEAFNWCKFLSVSPLPKGNNTVIVTNGGGVGVLATDACEKYGVELYDDTEILKEVFSPVTPSFGSTKNPVDITGSASHVDYDLALKAALGNENIDAVITLYCETATTDFKSFEPIIKENYQQYKAGEKPIVFTAVGGEQINNLVKSLRTHRVPTFTDPYDAVSCLGMLFWYHDYRETKSLEIDEVDMNIVAINGVINHARTDDRTFLLAHEAREMMEIAGIDTPRSKIARSIEEAVTFAEEIGYPVVMKVVSKDIIHKSDAGGIALDLDNGDEVIDAYQAIMVNSRQYKPNAVIEGIEMGEMVDLKAGTEVIIGAKRDLSFGPIVMFGLGGIYVEVMKDVSFRALPINKKEILGMIEEIKSYPLLLGVRGEPRKNIEGIADIMIKIGTILRKCKDITDIEINPVVAFEKRVIALDVRILLSKADS
ncbi:MAG: acetate--CoA ligase family protein [Candidatus Hodarchaeales archaeon]|jgi:acetyltransferase